MDQRADSIESKSFPRSIFPFFFLRHDDVIRAENWAISFVLPIYLVDLQLLRNQQLEADYLSNRRDHRTWCDDDRSTGPTQSGDHSIHSRSEISVDPQKTYSTVQRRGNERKLDGRKKRSSCRSNRPIINRQWGSRDPHQRGLAGRTKGNEQENERR